MTNLDRNQISGILFTLASAFTYGSVTTQAKIFYEGGGNAMTLVFWRYLVATVVVACILKLTQKSVKPIKKVRLQVIILSVVFSGTMVLYLKSVESISVSLAVLLLFLFPIIVMLICLITGRMRVSIINIGAFFLAFIGIALLLGGNDLKGEHTGIMLACLAACGAAYTFVKGGDIAPVIHPLVLAFWINLTGLILVLFLVIGQFSMPSALLSLLCLLGATLSYIIAILTHFAALARLSAPRVAFIFNFEPVVSLVLAAVVLSESLASIQWVGVVLILILLPLFNFLYKPTDKQTSI
ncbi:MAG: EamA family transporter [Gammaproteobacteria bacterium]|nr:EamA family transporter [Gammaproteobacteria bacterium]MCY4274331.1 EamA family transporter [Gammaproteobacteria bacterium]